MSGLARQQVASPATAGTEAPTVTVTPAPWLLRHRGSCWDAASDGRLRSVGATGPEGEYANCCQGRLEPVFQEFGAVKRSWPVFPPK